MCLILFIAIRVLINLESYNESELVDRSKLVNCDTVEICDWCPNCFCARKVSFVVFSEVLGTELLTFFEVDSAL